MNLFIYKPLALSARIQPLQAILLTLLLSLMTLTLWHLQKSKFFQKREWQSILVLSKSFQRKEAAMQLENAVVFVKEHREV